MKVLAILLFVVVAIAAVAWRSSANQSYISNYLAKTGEKAVLVDRKIIDHGPFWFVDEDDEVYEVKTDSARTLWFCFRTFRTEVKLAVNGKFYDDEPNPRPEK